MSERIYISIANIFMNLIYGEPFSDFYNITDLKIVLQNHNFTIEDITSVNDCINDKFFKFKHLNPIKRRMFNSVYDFMTTKLVK